MINDDEDTNQEYLGDQNKNRLIKKVIIKKNYIYKIIKSNFKFQDLSLIEKVDIYT